ncbi:MAG TPA: DNA recombination protein RmuC [Rhodanobacteraceae bacterium]|nr:DNA recombination protein RmuC [Rhodanobacteraceae bacterium]
MSTEIILLVVLIVLAACVLLLQLAALARGRGDPALREKLDALRSDSQRLDQTLRDEQRAGRGELTQSLDRLGERLQKNLGELSAGNEKRLGEVRGTLETQLKLLQTDNAEQLERMRKVVDEKLQATLEARLGASFKQVSEHLEAVQRGLGEMRTLASGVGDLNRVLTNVKNRGIFGETQLAALLSEMLTPDQYLVNVATVPGSNERVEFAVRLPGATQGQPVLLPIDAKFPREDYERLLDAQERADAAAANDAALALERRVREEAKTIHAKYIAPPATTDFAILFLPTESLYAEVLRRPGLFEAIQREHHVTLAGPTTLSALLNSLRLGFRTLAIEQRSSEVWQTLGAVKTEFGKFGDVLGKVKKKLDEASTQLDATGVRSRAIVRKLRDVESLPAADAQALLGDASAGNDEDDASESDDDPALT